MPRRKSGWFRLVTVGLLAASLSATAGPRAVAAIGDVSGFDVPTLTALPHGVVVGPDGAIWFTERSANQIGRVDLLGTFSEYPLEGTDPTVIVVGSDGNLWFTEQAGNRIGRISPAGEVAEREISNPATAPAGLAAGPDGNIWFTERDASAIGRLTTDLLTLDEFATPTPDARPTAIVAAPDGNLWFTERGMDQLGRAATDGSIDEFLLPGGSQPSGIVVGPDGHLWVTLRGRNSIAEVGLDGSLLDEHVVPTLGANASWITSGPGGDLWFTETGADRVGRVTTDGAFTEYPLSAGAVPQGIVEGTDGAPWFAEAQANRIATLDLTGGGGSVDQTAPTIEIRTPVDDTVLLLGSSLASDYACDDEPGGSGLARCDGPVADGDDVPTSALGARTFSVTAEDVAGNVAQASTSYLVFRSIDGTLLMGPSRPGAWLTLELGMDLPDRGADPVATVVSEQVACGDPTRILSLAQVESLRWRVDPRGVAYLRWDTDRTWGGQCRALTLTFAAPGWQGPSATFLATFEAGVTGKQSSRTRPR